MALCMRSLIGGTQTHTNTHTQAELLGETTIQSLLEQGPLLAHSAGVQSKGLYPCGK